MSDLIPSIPEAEADHPWNRYVATVLQPHAIDYTDILDLAAGQGLGTTKFAPLAKTITIVDCDDDAIRACRQQFGRDPRFKFIRNNGITIAEVYDSSISFFSVFDAMVHFDLETVQSYVKEAYRVLRANGHGFFHYSNFSAFPGADVRRNPYRRNFMSKPLFEHIALRAGFAIVSSATIPWGGIRDLDGIALLRKPG
jgi:ubiquinone/menaquinone biosynthesis C-methylase UbiE